MHSEVIISLGSNLGNRKSALSNALAELSKTLGEMHCMSGIYESDAWGYDGQPYLNQVAVFRSSKSPHEVLECLMAVEDKLGRPNRQPYYEDRFIDLDLLFYDDLIVIMHDLIIPHPKLHDRRFVLVPLAEIAPHKVHPSVGKSAQELLDECVDKAVIEKVECATNT
jgi:2-amino-4-hydroxy-6-hydroxymethyldihydropteridine diphosphokinase